MEEEEDLYGAPAAQTTQQEEPSTSQPRARSEDTEVVDYEPEFQPDAEDEAEQAMEEEEGSDSDVEIITDRPPMSLDNRGVKGQLPSPQPLQSQTTSSSLTTEYTPQRRRPDNVDPPDNAVTSSAPTGLLAPERLSAQVSEVVESTPAQPKIDTSTLPPAIAPSTHPAIDPTIPGVYDGRPIFDHDMDALAEKPWRRPGSNISDWFNYGFDEISWEAYCYRRRQLGEDANVLRANVISFSGLADHEVTSLPPEARAMVMTGTTTLMHNQQVNGMMSMNSMMGDMSGIQMPMGMSTMQPVGNDYPAQSNEVAESGQHMVLAPDGSNYAHNTQHNIGGDYPIQAEAGATSQVAESNASAPSQASTPSNIGRGGSYGVGYRGRGAAQPPQAPARARAAFRGRGMPPQGPARSTSPLPPNVPTGPRNQNRYKDRDGPSGASDGLDYGGNHKESHHNYHEDDRGRSRKRRASPRPDDYSRGSKRR